jgi:hypothetical protein
MFKEVMDGLFSAVLEMHYRAREMMMIVDSLWTMNLNEVSSRFQEMAHFAKGFLYCSWDACKYVLFLSSL